MNHHGRRSFLFCGNTDSIEQEIWLQPENAVPANIAMTQFADTSLRQRMTCPYECYENVMKQKTSKVV